MSLHKAKSKLLSQIKYHWPKLKENPLKWLWCYIPAQLLGKLGYPLLVMPFRAYARNTVYNYHLLEGHGIKRLKERKPAITLEVWDLTPIHAYDKGFKGTVKFRPVTVFEYYFVLFFIWGWLDDDSNHDTTDWGHIQNNFPEVAVDITAPVFGNSFDLGDKRADYPFFNLAAWWIWNWRNTAMNFKYLWLGY